MASGKSKSPDWVTAKAAAEILGISTDHLRRLRQTKILKKGKHWRSISPNALRSSFRYNPIAIQQLFDKD